MWILGVQFGFRYNSVEPRILLWILGLQCISLDSSVDCYVDPRILVWSV